MPVNQKPVNQIMIFWYHFTPRKLLYLMIAIHLVKFGPHLLVVLGGHPVYKIKKLHLFMAYVLMIYCILPYFPTFFFYFPFLALIQSLFFSHFSFKSFFHYSSFISSPFHFCSFNDFCLSIIHLLALVT